MAWVIGGMDREDCPTCGNHVAVYTAGQFLPHGPLNDRCIGRQDAPEPMVRQHPWDASAGRAHAGVHRNGVPSVEERMRNATALLAAVDRTIHPHGENR